jgi:hypothetical protein
MRTIYSPYKNQNNPTEPSSSHPVKKERESLSSQTLETCPTWTSSDDSMQLNQTFSHESNVENNDPLAPPRSTAKERKRWIESTLLSKKEYTPFNTPAREEYCRNKSNRDLTAERKQWIETTLLTKEQKTYNTKIREEYCKNKDNHELTNERKRWIEETLLTKTNTLPSTPSNKKLKAEKESAEYEIVEEVQVPVAQRLHQFTGPSEIDAELMKKLKQRKQAEDKADANPHAAKETRQRQLLAEEEARQLQLMAEVRARERQEEQTRQSQLVAKEEARQLQLIAEATARQRQDEEARQRKRKAEEEAKRQRQLVAEEEARQRQLFEEEARRMEQDRINEEAKLAGEAIAALQRRLDEERLKREVLEEEARLAKEARDEEHRRFVELAENAKLFETRIGQLEQQEQQRSKMRAYITTLKEEKKLRADELAIVEELEKDIESEDEDGDDDDIANEYQRYLSSYLALAHPSNENEEIDLGSICPREETENARPQIGVQSGVPRRTPLVIRSVGSFTDLSEMKQASAAKKHKKRMKLLELLVKMLGRAKRYEC